MLQQVADTKERYECEGLAKSERKFCETFACVVAVDYIYHTNVCELVGTQTNEYTLDINTEIESSSKSLKCVTCVAKRDRSVDVNEAVEAVQNAGDEVGTIHLEPTQSVYKCIVINGQQINEILVAVFP